MPDGLNKFSLKPGERKKLENQNREIKSYINFYDTLFNASSLADFLFFLYKETARQFKARSFFFCWCSGHFGPLQYMCHSKRIYKTSSEYKRFNERERQSIRIRDELDIQYWAKSLGRPIQNILTVPIYTNQYSAKYPCYIFVEFFIKTPEKLLGFYETYLPLITKCLDRLLWQDHLETSIELLTSTFDELNEPLAIFDEKNQLSNANLAFERLFNNKENVSLDQILQKEERIFEKHSYPALIKGNEYRVCHYADISESLSLRTQMIQNRKMSALGELGESVAHQLNNPLAGVLSMAQWLLSSYKLNKEERKDIEDIAEGVSRSQEIISNLLDFSRAGSQLEVYDLNVGVQKTVPLLKSLIHFSDLQIELFSAPVLVKTQACLLRQVIFNLMKNACQAVASLKDCRQTVKVRVLREKEKAFLCVEDSGSGIPPEDYENVFKPFFTTKSESQGTGLGLSMSRNIVESFAGSLTAGRSGLGGACFTMTLPLESEGDMV